MQKKLLFVHIAYMKLVNGLPPNEEKNKLWSQTSAIFLLKKQLTSTPFLEPSSTVQTYSALLFI